MKKSILLLACLVITSTISAAPSWMWIGTYGIDNYTGNGGGSNLTQSIAGANEFMDAADVYCPLAINQMSLRDADVTRVAVCNNSTREMCDFIYFDGHGSIGSIFLGNGSNYGSVYPSGLQLGTSYNRWAYFYTCLSLHLNAVSSWFQGFSGIRTVLGFSSLTWAVSTKELIHNQFWDDWVNNDVSMINAHFDSCEDWLWSYYGIGIAPAMVTSDYDAYFSYDETNSAAGGEADEWVTRVCGNPEY